MDDNSRPGWEWQQETDSHRHYEETQMGLTARKPEGGDFEQPPAGTHVARCWRIVDLGTQDNPFPPHRPNHQIFVSFELCNELMDDGRPFTIGQFYTLSLHEKAKLRHHLEAWRGRAFTDAELEGFEVTNIMGAPCMLNIIQESKDGATRSKISGVMAMPKGQTAPATANQAFAYNMDDNAHWDQLPEWLQERIENSHERTGKIHQPDPGVPVGAGHDDFDDDIPF